jgi:glycosyltransferase involved in cell wall biosynthesis
MKILIVSNLYYPNGIGGAEKVAQNLAEGLLARGHEAVVVTLNPEKVHNVDEVNGVRVHRLPVRNFYFPNQAGVPAPAKILWHALDSYNPFMAASLGRVLDAERPDVVNTHNITGFSAVAWKVVKEGGLPLVHTAHDYYALCPKCTMRRADENCASRCADCRIYSRPRRRLSKLVDVLTAPSRFVLERHAQYGAFLPAEKIPVHNCNSLPGSNGNHVFAEERPFRFGFLGRLHPSKGVSSLVRSFLDFPAGRGELWIAGRGTTGYEQELRSLADGHPGIRWLGYVQPNELFGKVDVLVVPSLWQDPAPLVVLESLGHGVPVIGARRGGIPELVGEGTGWIFDPNAQGSLTSAMTQAFKSWNELAGMSERAVEWARQFSTDAMVAGYLRAYHRATGDPSDTKEETPAAPRYESVL